jgi:hypothetical protein
MDCPLLTVALRISGAAAHKISLTTGEQPEKSGTVRQGPDRPAIPEDPANRPI